jgi:hypothetical protein
MAYLSVLRADLLEEVCLANKGLEAFIISDKPLEVALKRSYRSYRLLATIRVEGGPLLPPH